MSVVGAPARAASSGLAPRVVSLKLKLALSFGVLLSSVSIFLFWFFPTQMNAAAQRLVERRGIDIAAVLATALAPAVDFDDRDAIAKHLGLLDSVAEGTYALVCDRNGGELGRWAAKGEAPVSRQCREGAVDAAQVTSEAGVLHVSAPIRATSGGRGTLVLGISLRGLETERRANTLVVGVVSAAVLAVGLLIAWIVGTWLVRPIGALTAVTTAMVTTRRLREDIDVRSHDEVEQLADSFRVMVGQLRAVLLRVKGTSTQVAEVVAGLSRTGESVSGGAKETLSRLQESSSSVGDMRELLDSVRRAVEVLQENADAVHAATVQMSQSNEGVTKIIDDVASSVTSTTGSIEDIAASSVAIAGRVEEVNRSGEQTSGSLLGIHAAIERVEASAREASARSEAVVLNANAGMKTVERTLGGLERIRQVSSEASTLIQSVSKRLSGIGEVVNVINDVADQTNLLALNAAIIAAQAGEHGRGFSVVADEIKTLADKTRRSTVEIAASISGIQKEAAETVEAMSRGMQTIGEGVNLGTETRQALEEIVRSAETATRIAVAIVKAAEEQTQDSAKVAAALQTMVDGVDEISRAAAAQAQSAEQVRGTTARMNALTVEMRSSSREQAAASRDVTKATDRIAQMITEVSRAQGRQSESTSRVLGAVARIQDLTGAQIGSVAELEQAIRTLRQQASLLQGELDRFEV